MATPTDVSTTTTSAHSLPHIKHHEDPYYFVATRGSASTGDSFHLLSGINCEHCSDFRVLAIGVLLAIVLSASALVVGLVR